MRLLHRIIVGGVIILGAAIPSLACICRELSNEESFRRSDVVFVAKKLASADTKKQAYEVQQVIKGAVSGRVEVDTSLICDFDNYLGEPGSTYIVYAQKRQGMLSLELCGAARPIEASQIQVGRKCGDYERRASFWDKMIVTAICVSLSLSLGWLVNIVRKRF